MVGERDKSRRQERCEVRLGESVRVRSAEKAMKSKLWRVCLGHLALGLSPSPGFHLLPLAVTHLA